MPDLVALCLVGAFGRGEGSVIQAPGGWRPLNDYDLVLVHRAGARVPDLSGLRRSLARELGFEHVDVELIAEDMLPRLPVSMHAYDLKYGGRVIHGAPDVLDRIPPIAPEAVNLDHARLLLFNRLTCLLQWIEAADLERPPAMEHRLPMAYMAHKVMLSVAASRLARSGLHDVHYAERARRFRARFSGEPALIALVEASTEFKLAPPSEVPDPRPLWFDVRDAYVSEIRAVVELTHGRAFPDWPSFARVHEGNRARDRLRKVKWWLLDRSKLTDIQVGQRRADVELAELLLTAAPGRDGTFEEDATQLARARIAPYAPDPGAGWEACRRAAVALDLTYLHPP